MSPLPVLLDLGGLRSLPNRIASFINGPLVDEIKNAVLIEAMPALVQHVSSAMGVPVSVGGEVRPPAVTGGVGGVSASYSFSIIQDEEEEDKGGPQYGIMPIIRQGGHVYIVASSRPNGAGQAPLHDSFQRVMNDDDTLEVVLPPIGGAIGLAKEL